MTKDFKITKHTKCPTCGAAFYKGEEAMMEGHWAMCSRFMWSVPMVDQEGNVTPLGTPDEGALMKHIAKYGDEGAACWLGSAS